MKRFLSWVVLLVCNKLMEILTSLFGVLVIWVWSKLIGAGIVAIIVVALLAGGTGISIAIMMPAFASAGTAWLSQRVYKSKAGRRYTINAVVFGLLYAGSLFNAAIEVIGGDAEIQVALAQIIAYALMVYFEVMVAVSGHERVRDDGAPMTKKQRLEAQLAKEQDKEEKAAALEALKEMERKGIDIKAVIAEAEGKSRLEEQQDGHNT